MASTPPASSRLTRPRTAFCSCTTLGNLAAPRGQQGWQCRIAAKADDGRWLKTFKQAQRHIAPFDYRANAAQPFERVLAKPACGQDMRRQKFGLTRDIRAAFIGDQRHMIGRVRAAHAQAQRPGSSVPRCPQRRAQNDGWRRLVFRCSSLFLLLSARIAAAEPRFRARQQVFKARMLTFKEWIAPGDCEQQAKGQTDGESR